MSSNNSRQLGLDAFRLLAALSVIFLHVGYYEGLPRIFGAEMRLSGRWAVPFFFMLSGFFSAPSLISDPNRIAHQSAKAFWVLIVSSLAMTPLLVWQLGLGDAAKKIISTEVLSQGTHFHLWFLSSLSFGLFVFFAMRIYGTNRSAMALVALSLGIMIFDAYYPNGRPFQTFSRYLMCFPFLYLGMLIRWKNLRLTLSAALGLTFLGVLLQNVEAYVLRELFDKSPFQFDFLIGTIPFATGAFFLAMQLPESPRLAVAARLGQKYSLGIYVFHPYFIYILTQGVPWNGRVYSLSIVPLTFVMTLLSLGIVFRYFPASERILAASRGDLQRLDDLQPFPPAFPDAEDD
ncbi:acyltransferase [Roseiconus nitratireducens]|uniref:Acyltransferase n=1 Tax=Roseiconus nitratireducens TaxID=2605748 RepID=A0A5M6DLW4_9BACT|nr:acyltransferase [Roseiconus nitratireducens]KAA5547120.1 acyltransferase [Roseiconus nitratireducens]